MYLIGACVGISIVQKFTDVESCICDVMLRMWVIAMECKANGSSRFNELAFSLSLEFPRKRRVPQTDLINFRSLYKCVTMSPWILGWGGGVVMWLTRGLDTFSDNATCLHLNENHHPSFLSFLFQVDSIIMHHTQTEDSSLRWFHLQQHTCVLLMIHFN